MDGGAGGGSDGGEKEEEAEKNMEVCSAEDEGAPEQKRHLLLSSALLLCSFSGIRKYGRDFQAISDVIGNKSVVQVKNFLVNYRRRFNLDEVLQEWEAEQEMDGGAGGGSDGGEKEEEAEKNMEVCSAEDEGAPEQKDSNLPVHSDKTLAD
ncbi:REST corepressor 1 [Austrofundulus limnaeus]|uniref:REST corepressor 1 n=1 Tax=Austrofundulus limnaeus TaxID=52670 RepID=A0A2I4CC15_AUSLI|nr:PREDICTED: REST corepressor 1-like [Austrofundulus limnaeus]